MSHNELTTTSKRKCFLLLDSFRDIFDWKCNNRQKSSTQGQLNMQRSCVTLGQFITCLQNFTVLILILKMLYWKETLTNIRKPSQCRSKNFSWPAYNTVLLAESAIIIEKPKIMWVIKQFIRLLRKSGNVYLQLLVVQF